MKKWYTHSPLTALLLLAGSMAWAQPYTKTLVKSFKLEAHRTVTFLTQNEVESSHWNQPFMRVEVQIVLENGQPALLRSLVGSGRYQLLAKPADEGLQLEMPRLAKSVMLGEEELQEQIRLVVRLPEGTVLNVRPTGEVALTGM
jgi:hypothetical protein